MNSLELHGYAWIDPDQAAYKVLYAENAEKLHLPQGEVMLFLQMEPDSRQDRAYFSSKLISAKLLDGKHEGDQISIPLENNVKLVLTLNNKRAYEAADNPLPIEKAAESSISKLNASKKQPSAGQELEFLKSMGL